MASLLTSPDDTAASKESSNERGNTVMPADKLFELLGDKHTRRILEMIADESLGGREIAEAASLSRPTVYRRLGELEEAGLVKTTMAIRSDGHHHKKYSAVLEKVNLALNEDGLTATVQTGHNPDDTNNKLEKRTVADD